MSTWEERMAASAAARQAAADADRERRLAGLQARLAVEFPAIDGEYDEVETDRDHFGHRRHSHPSHPNYDVCSCGEHGGSWSVAVDPDHSYEWPEPCPVCIARGIPFGDRERVRG